MSEQYTCPRCGKILGELVTIRHNGAEITVLLKGGDYLPMADIICANCDNLLSYRIGTRTMLRFLRAAGREVTEAEIDRPHVGG